MNTLYETHKVRDKIIECMQRLPALLSEIFIVAKGAPKEMSILKVKISPDEKVEG